MRLRLVLGGLAAALAVGTAMPAAQAAPERITCAPGFEIICIVVCKVSRPLCAT